jgi:hypothetical protein
MAADPFNPELNGINYTKEAQLEEAKATFRVLYKTTVIDASTEIVLLEEITEKVDTIHRRLLIGMELRDQISKDLDSIL